MRGEIMHALKTKNVVHLRFDGRSQDVDLELLNISNASSEAEIKLALSKHLEVSLNQLRDYVIDRHENGNLTLRPQAVFG
jgi:hypothetical protein